MRLSVATLGVILLAGPSGLAFAADGTPTAGSATTGQGMMTDAQIQQKLQSEGHTNVQVTKHDEGYIDVTATKDGRAEKLAVNPKTGAVRPETDSDND